MLCSCVCVGTNVCTLVCVMVCACVSVYVSVTNFRVCQTAVGCYTRETTQIVVLPVGGVLEWFHGEPVT